MKISYDKDEQRYTVDHKDTLILTRNGFGIQIDDVSNFNLKNTHIVGRFGKFGRVKQLITSFMFIYGVGKFKNGGGKK